MNQSHCTIALNRQNPMNKFSVEPEIQTRLGVPLEKIEGICHEWGILELALFGSILRADFKAESDIDLLVTFCPHNNISLFDLVTIEEQFKNLLHRPVDVVTKESILKSSNPIRRKNILENSETIYVKG
jgi:predicted nucleotidyltransferase